MGHLTLHLNCPKMDSKASQIPLSQVPKSWQQTPLPGHGVLPVTWLFLLITPSGADISL